MEFLTFVAKAKGLYNPPRKRPKGPIESPLRHPERIPTPTIPVRD